MKKKPSRDREITDKKPPDGGWGWFVCLGSSFIALSLRSLDPSFGLLFQDLLVNLEIESTGTSLIMSVLDAIINFSGLFIGPLLKRYSYRKVAFFGSLLSCIGLVLTSRANSMLHIICTYSVIVGLGTGFALASAFVALNTFFDKKRGQAVGFSMAGTSLAMMLVPQLIHMLLKSYGFRGTMLIMSACSLHSVVGACLLRPLKTCSSKIENKKVEDPKESDALLREKKSKLNRGAANGSRKWIAEELKATKKEKRSTHDDDHKDKADGNDRKMTFCEKIRETFDLDLLKNTVYLNVVIGASLYYVSESNFKLITPFFLSSIGMSKAEVAFCLSLTAFTDILARITLPTIFDRLGFKKRSIFWIFSLLVGIVRSVLAERSKGTSLIVIFAILGFLRGAALVNLNLSVSECCSLKKLPSAFGIFMVSKGICVITMSPLIGFIRDYTDNYRICIHIMTAMIVTTFVTWTIEYFYCTLHRKRRTFIKNTQNISLE